MACGWTVWGICTYAWNRGAELKTYTGRVLPVGEFLHRYCAAKLAGERVLVAGADRFPQGGSSRKRLSPQGLRWPMEW